MNLSEFAEYFKFVIVLIASALLVYFYQKRISATSRNIFTAIPKPLKSFFIFIAVFGVGIFVFLSYTNRQNDLVASKRSHIYHHASCIWAKRIDPENLIEFKNSTDAVNWGYRPCKICKPPYLTHLKE